MATAALLASQMGKKGGKARPMVAVPEGRVFFSRISSGAGRNQRDDAMPLFQRVGAVEANTEAEALAQISAQEQLLRSAGISQAQALSGAVPPAQLAAALEPKAVATVEREREAGRSVPAAATTRATALRNRRNGSGLGRR